MQERSYITVNGSRVEVEKKEYTLSLLEWLRTKANMLSVRSGCTGEKKCGVCLVEVEGQAIQSCKAPVHTLLGKNVYTVEAIPEPTRSILAKTLLYNTSVPCGYCTAGLLIKIHILLKEKIEHSPSSLIQRLGFSTCTCIGVRQIIQAVLEAQEYNKTLEFPPPPIYAGMPSNSERFGEERIVYGQRPFAEDICSDSIQLYGVIIWGKNALCTVEDIQLEKAQNLKGVHGIITYHHVTTREIHAPDGQEWRIFLREGDIAYCESEIYGVILAHSKEDAYKARDAVQIEADIYEPKIDITEILAESTEGQAPVLHKTLHYGEPIENLLQNGICTANEVFYSHPASYNPLESPCAVAMFVDGHLHIYTQVADLMWLKRAVRDVLGIAEEYIHCMRTETNILFDAREDYLLALHTAIASYITQSTVQLSMTHEEVAQYRSQPIETIYDYTLLLNEQGELLGGKLSIVVNGGAYTTDIMNMCDTIIKHATSGFLLRNVELSLMLVSTNTVPRYMPRGKCLESSCIVMNRLLDKLSKLSKFNRFEIRAKNILKAGDYTITGEYLYGDIASTELLTRAKKIYDSKPSVSLSISCIDTGLASTNAMAMVAIDIMHGGTMVVYQPFPEYGNGLTTLIAQVLVGELGKENYSGITIRSTTDCMEEMQTIPHSDSAMLYLLYHAIKDAVQKLREALYTVDTPALLAGNRYIGFSFISSEAVYSVMKEKKNQGNYTMLMHIARCEEPYIFNNLTVLVDAGIPFNERFTRTLIEGGISQAFTAMVGSKDIGNQPLQIDIQFVYNKNTPVGYSFKGVYHASMLGLASSYYSYIWTNNKKNLAHYPLS